MILEAAHAGLPVIAARVGGIPELIEHQETGLLIPPNDPEKLSGALQVLIEDIELRKKLGDALRKKLAPHLSLSKMLERTFALYE